MKNIVQVEIIENLCSEINNHLGLIMPNNPMQQISKEQGLQDINDFQVGTLHDMRILFEGENNGLDN